MTVVPRISDWDPAAMYCSKRVEGNYSMNEWNRNGEKRSKSRRRENHLDRMAELVRELGQEKPTSTEPTSPQ